MARPVAVVFGASRGMGRAIALTLAQEYIVVVSAKSTSSVVHKVDGNSFDSTINTVAHDIAEAGGEAVAMQCDVRDTAAVTRLIQDVYKTYNRLDAVVYNPGAIWWQTVAGTPTKRLELMWEVNARGFYAAVQACLPIFERQAKGRIIAVAPPIYSRFFRQKTAYAMTKVAMSVLVKGLAMDWDDERKDKQHDLAISALWPAVSLTSAITNAMYGLNQTTLDAKVEAKRKEAPYHLRDQQIFADAVLEILHSSPAVVNGQLLLDEDFLREHCHYTDMQIAKYRLDPAIEPRRIMPRKFPDLSVEEQEVRGNGFLSGRGGGGVLSKGSRL
ncbi:hypothetical protein BZG36_00327 [Bifiguratus adelaidae]|uniref:Uncharacterized protein n=1 Tax=Bifiguratus adelaidae TaxID=1938954 RepID=A0A261Y7W6_9FUNG|nr:hypothetical protein BZG36_00327 [Bifiguratus adelaidae]